MWYLCKPRQGAICVNLYPFFIYARIYRVLNKCLMKISVNQILIYVIILEDYLRARMVRDFPTFEVDMLS